jgi:diketogulonate reductase-like aldo/keto reductase
MGIRHFDVAPMYGYGEAESCLGDLLRRHPDITVTTKYGIPPAKNSTLLRLGRPIAASIVKHIPVIKHRLVKVANTAATHNQPRPAFTAAQAAASLERSLHALHTSRIDLWLLHEPTAFDLHEEALLYFLEDQLAKGTIGGFGIGSSADKISALLTQHPACCRVLQSEWSVLNPAIPESSSFRIHHRALTSHFRALHTALIKNKTICQRWSQIVDADLNDPTHLARLMLKAALVLNPSSIILFSSKSPSHIRANYQTANDTSLEIPSRRFHALVQNEIHSFSLPIV